jgi:hypothetical protein
VTQVRWGLPDQSLLWGRLERPHNFSRCAAVELWHTFLIWAYSILVVVLGLAPALGTQGVPPQPVLNTPF